MTLAFSRVDSIALRLSCAISWGLLLRWAIDQARNRKLERERASTATAADLDWQVGVRRMQDNGDTALVGGVSLALGGARRAAPDIRAAEADLAALEIERESRDIALYSTLTDAHGRYRVAQIEVQRTRDDVLPRLGVEHRIVGPQDRSWRDSVDAYLGRQLDRQRPRQSQ